MIDFASLFVRGNIPSISSRRLLPILQMCLTLSRPGPTLQPKSLQMRRLLKLRLRSIRLLSVGGSVVVTVPGKASFGPTISLTRRNGSTSSSTGDDPSRFHAIVRYPLFSDKPTGCRGQILLDPTIPSLTVSAWKSESPAHPYGS